MILDIHTHSLRTGALVNLDPASCPGTPLRPEAPYFYSVGIHPWHAVGATPALLDELRRVARSDRVLAIGEAGLDSLHSGSATIAAQTQLLKEHIALSEELCKPLILHVVKRFPEVMQLKKTLRPAQPWIIHGFRGKPQLALSLLRMGFYLSYGEKFNPASVAVTPPGRLLVETDESALTVGEVASLLGVSSCAQCIAPQPGELRALDGRPLEKT